ncbi:MAG: DNA-binding protein [Gammaproteobacteria bacterium]|jgi:gp16 family phage-associated protein
MAIKTPEQVKAEFNRQGISIGSWAKANGFKREDVYAVLNGANKAKYGRAHAIAVALGLKAGVVGKPEEFCPVSAVLSGAQA